MYIESQHKCRLVKTNCHIKMKSSFRAMDSGRVQPSEVAPAALAGFKSPD